MSESDKREMIQAAAENIPVFFSANMSVGIAVLADIAKRGLPEKWGIQEGTFRTIVDSVGVILIAFGIMNDPTNPQGF